MNTIVFNNYTNAIKMIEILLEEDYVAMISREGELYLVSYLYSENSYKSNVVFMTREDYDTETDEIYDNIITDLRNEGKLK